VVSGTGIVSVAVDDPVNNETDVGFNANVALAILGLAETLRFTLPANPFRLFMSITNEAICPWAIDADPGPEPIVKSGELGARCPVAAPTMVEA
jgi:hypothetical protein